MNTKTKTATKRQSERVLNEVAKWLGTKGYGTAIACEKCAGCKDIEGKRTRWAGDPVLFCDDFKIGPAPTGPEVAYNGLGPELVMDFDFLGHGAHPAIVLEGGPYDWAVVCSFEVQEKLGKSVFVEPVTGWALGIYPWSF